MSMKEIVRFMAVGLIEELLVNSYYIGVFMRFAKHHMFIFRIDRLHPFLPDLHAGRYRLSATAKTSARALSASDVITCSPNAEINCDTRPVTINR